MEKIGIFIFGLLLSGCSQYLQQPLRTSQSRLGVESTQHQILESLPEPEEPIVVAVYKFKDQTGQYKETDVGSSWSTAVTQGATSILLRALEESNWFVPIEREGLNNLLNERKIIRSSRGGYETQENSNQPLIPPLLFGGVILEGGVISFDSNLMTGGAGARYFGLGSSGQYRIDRITVYLRAISTSNGRILKTVYTSKTILSQQVDVGIFRFVDFQRLLEAETGFTYNEPSEMAVREAIEKAVVSLIIEGAIDGLWKFQNPDDLNNNMVIGYQKEKLENESTNVFGTQFKDRRAGLSVGIHGAGWAYAGDYGESKMFPAAEIDLEVFSNRPVALNFAFGYGTIGTKDTYQADILLTEITANYRWFTKMPSTPYLRFGLGTIIEVDNNLPQEAGGFNTSYPFFISEIGYEHLIKDRLGLSLGANYRYAFDDDMDRVLQGKYNDAFWEGKIGVRYYFPIRSKEKKMGISKRKEN
ncbi:MAG: CsgG/HfaB family protein [Cyclobacteriaceae bacterium]